jgi:hypothetical protein
MAKKSHKKKSHFRRRLVKGSTLKGSGIALVTGAITGFVAGKLAENFEPMRRAWWVTPAVTAVGGHLLKAKFRADIGQAAIGGAGTMTYYNWILSRAGAAASGTQGVQETQGVQDTGDLDYVAAMNALPETTGASDVPRYAPSGVAGLQMG